MQVREAERPARPIGLDALSAVFEVANEVVPDVDMDGVKMMGEATICVCLFSPVWTWVDPV